MTHAALSESYQDADLNLLVLFASNSGTWRYTNSNAFVTAMGETWEPVPGLEFGAITQSGELAKDKLPISFPIEHFMAQRFLGVAPEETTSVTIFDGYLSDVDGEYLTGWKGRVLGGKPSGKKNVLQCETLWRSVSNNGLNGFWLKQCEHILYGRGCRLNKDDFEVTSTCTAVSGVIATVDIADSQPDGHWVGGMLKGPDGVFRWVVGHSGKLVTLAGPLESLTGSGEAVSIYPGCDHTRGRCRVFFKNILNYGGADWLPDKNPMGGSSIR